MSKLEDLAPLAPILQALIENSGLDLGEMETLETGLAALANQFGVNLADVRVGRTLINPTDDGTLPAEPAYRYDAAFTDPHPEGLGGLISVKDYVVRNWDAPTHSRRAPDGTRELDEFDRPRASTRTSHDASDIFADLDPEPQSVPAKRALAKKQEEEREELAAAARQRAKDGGAAPEFTA